MNTMNTTVTAAMNTMNTTVTAAMNTMDTTAITTINILPNHVQPPTVLYPQRPFMYWKTSAVRTALLKWKKKLMR